VSAIIMVGDAFGRPLCEELERQSYDTSSLLLILTGGAITSPAIKERFLAHLPHVLVADVAGASETGGQMTQISSAAGDTSSGIFSASPGTLVVDETMSRAVEPGHEGPGWLAKLGFIPLGYLGDQAKTERTFPVVDGQRMVIPGDRARLLEDGRIELLGRESVTINSGGEKIFAEEVEQALAPHADVDDVIVVGRPSERWGSEVVAVVQLHPGSAATDAELLAEAATHIASYKLPKAIIRVPTVRRSPAGKPDYGWARDIATQSAS
jgi:fatty-acyl-CoA synthase